MQRTINKRITAIIMIVCIIIAMCSMTAQATTKTASKTARFYGIHTTYGSSVWGVNFNISVIYDKTGLPYRITNLSTYATMNPIHTFGAGEVIVAGINETVDYAASTSRDIEPIRSPFWSVQSLISPPGTHVYYSYYGTLNKSFYYELDEEGDFTFSVPDTYFAVPNTSLNLSIVTPK